MPLLLSSSTPTGASGRKSLVSMSFFFIYGVTFCCYSVRFRLIRSSDELKAAIADDQAEKARGGDDEDEPLEYSWSKFPPEMCHQVYGEQ